MMEELFERIFWEVGAENDVHEWYNIFDSDLFEIVCERIANEVGVELSEYDCWSDALGWNEWDGVEEFRGWVNEMEGDL